MSYGVQGFGRQDDYEFQFFSCLSITLSIGITARPAVAIGMGWDICNLQKCRTGNRKFLNGVEGFEQLGERFCIQLSQVQMGQCK